MPPTLQMRIGETMGELKQDPAQGMAVKGAEMEEVTVIEQPALRLIGKRQRIVTEKGKDALAQIKEYWAQCEADGTLAALRSLVPDAEGYVAACHNFGKQEYDYWVAVEMPDEEFAVPEGYEELFTEESDYALFPCKGPALQSVFDQWAFVYRKWFPRGHYFHGTSPELEVYPFGDMEAETYACELRVPVKKVPENYYRRKRTPMKMMLLPLVGVFAGLVIGTRFGSATGGMLVGLLGGFVAATILQQIQENKDKEKDEKESGSSKK